MANAQSAARTDATVDGDEVRRFNDLASTWWDVKGPMKPLHAMNPTRLSFIRECAVEHFGLDGKALNPLKGLTAVDVGCGGGLLSEPMARMGAAVTGLDPAVSNIEVARGHAESMGLDIDYRPETIEAAVARGERFDIVLALEVIEHVADVPVFVRALSNAAKPGALVFVSTLNRSLRAYAAAIIGAEYVLRWLPVGTHDWNKFVRPDELEQHLFAADLAPSEMRGMVPDLLAGGWRLSSDMAVNYIACAVRGGVELAGADPDPGVAASLVKVSGARSGSARRARSASAGPRRPRAS
jgi:2-polyprenyl-6-hydroxyphenyl methylase / 3-demethylubiquinone-9 3-methyltransferase